MEMKPGRIEYSPEKPITPALIDKVVCEWSMDNGHAFTESEQIDLVDRLSLAFVPGASPNPHPVTKEK